MLCGIFLAGNTVLAVPMYLSAKLLGGKGTFAATLQLMLLTGTLFMPIIALLSVGARFIEIVLSLKHSLNPADARIYLVFGYLMPMLKIVHRISGLRATLAWLTATIAVIALVIFIAIRFSE